MKIITKIYQNLDIKHILLIGLLIRLLLWPWTFHGDVSANYWWGKYATEFGWRGFYDWLNFGGHSPPDQPMISIYYDWLVRQIYLSVHQIVIILNNSIPLFPSKFTLWFEYYGNQQILKLPMILADLLIIYFCYQITKSRIIALIIALYIPYIYNSSVWGSGDSIICLFGYLSIFLLYKNLFPQSALFYILSVLYKPTLLFWLPLIIAIIFIKRPTIKQISVSVLVSLLIIYLISTPFHPVEVNPYTWFFMTFLTKILPGYLDVVTAYAMNFWSFIYGFQLKVDSFTIFPYISARLFSQVICLILYLIILIKLKINYSTKQILLSLVTSTLVTFTFLTRMHERYTYPALIPLLLLSNLDYKFIKYFIILSITHTLNIFSAYLYPDIYQIKLFLLNDNLIRLVSLINIFITLKLVFTNFDKVKTNSGTDYPPPPKRPKFIS